MLKEIKICQRNTQTGTKWKEIKTPTHFSSHLLSVHCSLSLPPLTSIHPLASCCPGCAWSADKPLVPCCPWHSLPLKQAPTSFLSLKAHVKLHRPSFQLGAGYSAPHLSKEQIKITYLTACPHRIRECTQHACLARCLVQGSFGDMMHVINNAPALPHVPPNPLNCSVSHSCLLTGLTWELHLVHFIALGTCVQGQSQHAAWIRTWP